MKIKKDDIVHEISGELSLEFYELICISAALRTAIDSIPKKPHESELGMIKSLLSVNEKIDTLVANTRETLEQYKRGGYK